MAVFLGLVLRRTAVAPLVEPDYAHQLLAVDRFLAGEGMTSLQPVAPKQPWEWEYDFGFLTQWPVGYPLVVVGIRFVTGLGTLGACRLISTATCAFALVGWYLLARRTLPRGISSWLLAVVVALTAAPFGFLAHPSTDAIVVAAVPYLMLIMSSCPSQRPLLTSDEVSATSLALTVIAGFAAGCLVWIRYAAVFVPCGMGVYLIAQWCVRRDGRSARRLAAFVFAALVPMAALLTVNQVFGPAAPLHRKLNLGAGVSLNFSTSYLTSAFGNVTGLGWYDHRPESKWFFLLLPLALPLLAFFGPDGLRRKLRSFLRTDAVVLSICLIICLPAMLLTTTMFFSDKFNFIALERYYAPVKPLYAMLALAPLACFTGRPIRLGATAILLAGAHWTVMDSWLRPIEHARDRVATSEVTAYGLQANCFTPGAKTLYSWLESVNGPDLIVVSNFREYIALETGIAALPIPPDRHRFSEWMDRVAHHRGITHPRVLVVLDRSNRWRSHWLPTVDEIVRRLNLETEALVPKGISAAVWELQSDFTKLAATDRNK